MFKDHKEPSNNLNRALEGSCVKQGQFRNKTFGDPHNPNLVLLEFFSGSALDV